MKRRILSALLRAYESTDYEVYGDQPAVLRIGEVADDFLLRIKASSALIITAWNPRSERTAAYLNIRRQLQLIAAVAASGLKWLPAAGKDRHRRWPLEPSMCVLDAPADLTNDWLLRFGQNAAVLAEVGTGCRLVWHPQLR